MIPNVIWLIQIFSLFPFLSLFDLGVGEFKELPIKNYLHRTFVKVYFSHTS